MLCSITKSTRALLLSMFEVSCARLRLLRVSNWSNVNPSISDRDKEAPFGWLLVQRGSDRPDRDLNIRSGEGRPYFRLFEPARALGIAFAWDQVLKGGAWPISLPTRKHERDPPPWPCFGEESSLSLQSGRARRNSCKSVFKTRPFSTRHSCLFIEPQIYPRSAAESLEERSTQADWYQWQESKHRLSSSKAYGSRCNARCWQARRWLITIGVEAMRLQ